MLTSTLIWAAVLVWFQCLAINETDRLFTDKIWKNNPYIRPVLDSSKTVNVSITFEARALVSFDEVSQVIGCTGWFSIVWTDPVLAWNPDAYGNITVVTPPPSNIWKPPLFLIDMLLGPEPLSGDFISLRLNYLGEVTWTAPAVLQVYCESNMIKYPYERMLCLSHLILWTYNEDEVVLIPSHFSLDNVIPRKQWSISNAKLTASFVSLFQNTHSTIQISFSVLRISISFTFTFILPLINLAILSTFVFLIPANSGEKLSYAITICLSYGVYMGFLIAMTPLNSGLTAFSIFLTLCVSLSSVYTILSITSVNLSTRIDELYPVPERLARCVVFIERILHVIGQSSPQHNTDKVSPTTTNDLVVDVSDKMRIGHTTWNRVSRALDKTCFVFFFLMILVVTFSLMITTFR